MNAGNTQKNSKDVVSTSQSGSQKARRTVDDLTNTMSDDTGQALMAFSQDEDVVKTFSPNAPQETFPDGVGFGCAMRYCQNSNAGSGQARRRLSDYLKMQFAPESMALRQRVLCRDLGWIAVHATEEKFW